MHLNLSYTGIFTMEQWYSVVLYCDGTIIHDDYEVRPPNVTTDMKIMTDYNSVGLDFHHHFLKYLNQAYAKSS